MTTPDQPSALPRQPSFTDVVTGEETQVKTGTKGCGYVDPGCHGGMTCIRLPHTDTQPHVGRDTNGDLVQWVGPCGEDAAKAAQEFFDGAAK